MVTPRYITDKVIEEKTEIEEKETDRETERGKESKKLMKKLEPEKSL